MNQYTPKPPRWGLTLLEGPKSVSEGAGLICSLPYLKTLPKGDGHPVMVIPGFTGDNKYNLPLIRFLERQGYHATGWNQGRNFGHAPLNFPALIERVNELYETTGLKVSLIGHSLGGIYAREIAKLWPHEVKHVITLGTPFGKGREKASRVYSLYKLLGPNKKLIDESNWNEPPPVPTTAVYSRKDGIIDWQLSLLPTGSANSENIEIRGSHLGMTINPVNWYIINDRLRQSDNSWEPFQPQGWWRRFFPQPAWQPLQDSSGTSDEE